MGAAFHEVAFGGVKPVDLGRWSNNVDDDDGDDDNEDDFDEYNDDDESKVLTS